MKICRRTDAMRVANGLPAVIDMMERFLDSRGDLMANLNSSFGSKSQMVPSPSAWELFLVGVGVSESNCTSLLTHRSREGRAIRSWVRDHYTTKYVPESILEALGFRGQLRFRWQGDE
jgi:hypothetical protein